MHGPCPYCDSSDARFEYYDHYFCFSCRKYDNKEDESDNPMGKPVADFDIKVPHGDRGITQRTAERWGYGRLCQNAMDVANYLDDTGTVVGQKVRKPDKSGFYWLGEPSPCLYGQWLWPKGGRMVVVTEGEIDAMTVSQVLPDTPVVSIPNGASGAAQDLRKQYDWLSRFDKIILLFDNDEPGQNAMTASAKSLPPGKAYIAKLGGHKDANDALVATDTKAIRDAVNLAAQWRPKGIIGGRDALKKAVEWQKAPTGTWFHSGLQEKTLGFRRAEAVLICGGTGSGKTEFTRTEVLHLIGEGHTVGYIPLEEDPGRSMLGLLGMAAKKPIHIHGASQEELQALYEEHFDEGSLHFCDHWGDMDSDTLLNYMRYMVLSLGCTVLVLDHLSIATSGADWKEIDVLCTKMTRLLKDTGVTLLTICHLSRPEGGQSHEEGAQISLKHLRGSHSLGQLFFTIVALERNQQAEDPEERHRTLARVLKCRHTGSTGPAGYSKYNPETGCIEEAGAYCEFEEVF